MTSQRRPDDDPSIRDDDQLLRRVPNAVSPHFIKVDPATGLRSPSSAVFKTRDDDGISVYLTSVLTNMGMGPDALLRDPNNAVCALKASTARNVGLGVVSDAWPKDTDDGDHQRNAAHGLITVPQGLSLGARQKLARSLARNAFMVLDF